MTIQAPARPVTAADPTPVEMAIVDDIPDIHGPRRFCGSSSTGGTAAPASGSHGPTGAPALGERIDQLASPRLPRPRLASRSFTLADTDAAWLLHS